MSTPPTDGNFWDPVYERHLAEARKHPHTLLMADYLQYWKESLTRPERLVRIKTLPEALQQEIAEVVACSNLKSKECWRNAAQLAMGIAGVTFIEGVKATASMFMVHHAWNRFDGFDFDLTLELSEALLHRQRGHDRTNLLGEVGDRWGQPPLDGDAVVAALESITSHMKEDSSWRHLSMVRFLRERRKISNKAAWKEIWWFPLN